MSVRRGVSPQHMPYIAMKMLRMWLLQYVPTSFSKMNANEMQGSGMLWLLQLT